MSTSRTRDDRTGPVALAPLAPAVAPASAPAVGAPMPAAVAVAATGRRDFIFVRDLVLDCHVGVYAEEKGVTQKISFTVEADVAAGVKSVADDIAEVPSYADIIDGIEAIARSGHIELVETFAERIAAHCLGDGRISGVRVRLEKLERGPRRGVEIYRTR